MSSDRETLRSLVEEMTEDEARELLALTRQRAARTARKRPAWIGIMHEGPDFAKNAKDTLREELGDAR